MSMTNQQFKLTQKLFEKQTGILLGDHKKHMVENRLRSCLRACECDTFERFFNTLNSDAHSDMIDCLVDKLTTHETAFFREKYQFDLLEQTLKHRAYASEIKAWSAACSTGEEAYSIALVLDKHCENGHWQVRGTDISRPSIEAAQAALYRLADAESLPAEMRIKNALQGTGEFQGLFTFSEHLKRHCRFRVMNILTEPDGEMFDFIFLRNVLIYFTPPRQQQIIANVEKVLKPGGLLFLGHSENVVREAAGLMLVANCVYRKVTL
ncbi:CheR family methyltransferase [Vibrio vulnificus]|uniref:CheR family methyltransferase n=1 Tax=Vibrio vulnificus TaxID=672 RepID=UPI0010291A4F|nr:protein-glutamate O-methyltransferase CheR [Vibrio vulnificus]EGQ9933782.1 protein-glutamate O-methyltransferase CheR [Vibrio vulnificus]EGR0232339.1 protein-glutamate O-methyltransferase CheR [Vibrio vulnificus]ELI0608761.1 protein-glutamate O-methyltransferase CheR [Vibrio vulnificus]MCU8271203.1 protein-glutamate O-methyltransferase CheR [Vibrio vulnificus]RZQ18077.1 protein-glutamate O-methyltransferase CheR [Vibrio vulnificus]